jgi:hypothetical protein
MRRRLITFLFFAPLAVGLFAAPRWISTANEARNVPAMPPLQQRSRPTQRTPRWTGQEQTTGLDYGRFSHRSRSHQEACSSCHKVPTANWQRVRDFPDVADYPTHESCVRCHRQQFFNGARPVICSICHTRVSPRDGARFPFAKPNAAHQFAIEFPHDKHQDVIAALDAQPALDARHAFASRQNSNSQDSDLHAGTITAARISSHSEVRFVNASFVALGHVADNEKAQYNNCSICHATNTQALPKPARGGWPDAFVPAPESFKTAPASHASCFNCHWKNQSPTKDDCAGCHKLTVFKDQPINFNAPSWLARISEKFTHEREQHVAECTTCHINITRSSTLRGLKPDVPITSCASCHKTSTDAAIVTLSKEMDAREKDQSFVCAKCHTSNVGRKIVPASHAALFAE